MLSSLEGHFAANSFASEGECEWKRRNMAERVEKKDKEKKKKKQEAEEKEALGKWEEIEMERRGNEISRQNSNIQTETRQ